MLSKKIRLLGKALADVRRLLCVLLRDMALKTRPWYLLVAASALVMLLCVMQRSSHEPVLMPLPISSAPRDGPIIPYHDSFEYLLNNDVCGAGAVDAVVVVHSDTRHPEVRNAIRDSLPEALLRRLGVRRAFMLADASQKLKESETVISQSTVAEENAKYKDVVQGNFHDSYHNLTYKHIMALDWAGTFCPQARYIIKMDDDIVYNIFELLKMLHFIPDTGYIGGNIFHEAAPFRKRSKWIVSQEEWPRDVYPPYLSGWLYVVTPDVARALVMQSTVIPFFWIDDTYVTGILAEQLPITVRDLKKMYVTLSKCIELTVQQTFSLEKQSPKPVFKPSFVVGPTDRNLTALRDFNKLTRYCHIYHCDVRARLPNCKNTL
ncbi:beta-1,3-galactosyltransferase 5-like isoform X2 [Pollicipes pollicipes]|uniref:beta-1,3-galactosyltransferase 5-like isoform X2 n=1 Tax=Pollicipes pollicipes TaxID=41117 RepID=UPI00188545AA|nr:beta-1,3-galactosyltransferase 5-like isoform X2 [Pollicipes pollicipes]